MIWVHPLYPPLLEAILTKMTGGNVVYLIGTPGVGKTVLSALLVTVLLLLGIEVIYETYRKGVRPGHSWAFYFKPGQVCHFYALNLHCGASAESVGTSLPGHPGGTGAGIKKYMVELTCSLLHRPRNAPIISRTGAADLRRGGKSLCMLWMGALRRSCRTSSAPSSCSPALTRAALGT